MNEHDESLARLRAATQARLLRERGFRARLRALPTRTRGALVAAGFAAVALSIGFLAPRSDLAVYPRLLLVAGIAGLSGFAAYAAALLLRPMQARPVSARRILAIAAAAFGVTLVLALPEAHGFLHLHPESFRGVGDDFARHAALCFTYGMVTGLPFVALLFAVDRRERRPWPDVLLFAAAGGLAGNLALLLHCPLVAPAHLVAGHVPVTLGFLVLLLVQARLRRA